MSTKLSKRVSAHDAAVASRLARGDQFHTVSQQNCELVVLARSETQAVGVFRSWFEMNLNWLEFALVGLGFAHEEYEITVSDSPPPRGSQFAIFTGRRHGLAQVQIITV